MTNSQKIFIELGYREDHRRQQQQGSRENYKNDKYAEARKQAREKVKK